MSARSSIVNALVVKLKTINGIAPYTVNLYNNAEPKLRFWDEVQDFPFVCAVAGNETREYHPGGFKWGFLNVALKLYVYGEDAHDKLEDLLTDVETLITNNEVLQYESGKFTTEILITSIVTDEGLLSPYGVGEFNLLIRYQVS